jgi:hypothetical protein
VRVELRGKPGEDTSLVGREAEVARLRDLAFAGLHQLLRPVLDRVDGLPARAMGEFLCLRLIRHRRPRWGVPLPAQVSGRDRIIGTHRSDGKLPSRVMVYFAMALFAEEDYEGSYSADASPGGPGRYRLRRR